MGKGAVSTLNAGESTASDLLTLDSEKKTATVEVQTDIAYGLHEVDCPTGDDQDESKEGTVTLPSIKEMIGSKESDTLNFWWVYPVDDAKKKKLKPSTVADE